MAQTIESIVREKEGAIWWIPPDGTVYEAIAEMARRHVGALLVMEERNLLGIISERDYARKVILQGLSSRDTLVRQIMTPSPITVTPRHSVADCMRVMTHHRIRHLPVMDRGMVVGVVSIGDMVNAIISEQAETIGHLQSYIGAGYPG